MNTGVIRSMLLLDEPNITTLRIGIENLSKVFLSVAFIGALTWEFLTDMKFFGIVKNLVLALIFMSFFYQFHTKAVDLSFKASEELLREVSPKNIFLRRWSEVKVKTAQNSSSSIIERFVVPNLNDLLGTALFLLSKVCILILKLIYTTVYYFTFIFAPVTAVLSFLPISKHSMGGTIISSLWCILLPFVLVVFLALVGNSVQMPAQHGELAANSMDQLIWIFGITLLMLLAPSFTFSLIKGTIASTADAVGVNMTGVGAKALVSIPVGFGLVQKLRGKDKSKMMKGKNNNFKNYQNYNPNYGKSFSSPQSFQNSPKMKGGLSLNRSNQSTSKLSEMKVSQKNTQGPGVSSGASLANHKNLNSNIVNPKIPNSTLNSSKNQNLNGGQQLNGVERGMKINPSAKFVSRPERPPFGMMKNILNQVKNVKSVKTAEVRTTNVKLPQERRMPKYLKPAFSKERQREV